MTSSDPLTPGERRARTVAVGCLMAFAGALSMAMVGVLISVIVAKATGAEGCPGIPTCNWYIYALAGGVFGMLSLPALVLSRLNRPNTSASASDSP